MRTRYHLFVAIFAATCLSSIGWGLVASEQAGVPQSDIVDRYQRTYEILQNNEAATSGVTRGKTIYFYKCWMCHQEVAAEGDLSGLVGPSLHDLDQGSLTADAIATKIRNGGPRMPAFRHTLTDADVADLVTYLQDPSCCYELLEPPYNPHYKAETDPWPVTSEVKGGVRGVVHLANGYPLEGIKVQLIAPNAVRTTVFTDEDGGYEFPALQTGSYTLRIATPLPYKAFVREDVSISGAATLDPIVLEMVPSAVEPVIMRGALPPTLEVMSQMSGAEWLWNLPGTDEQKTTFVKSCGIGCHSYELIFRNRYDERSWRLIVQRMKTGPQGGPGREIDTDTEAGVVLENEIDSIAGWLARVRGPDSQDMPVRMWKRTPRGAATRVVITEYEPNRRLLNLHDVCGDAQGRIWYTSHHAPQVGYLDPKTGIIKEYLLPDVNGRPTVDSHACRVDDTNGFVWFVQGPPQNPRPRVYYRLDMATEEIVAHTAVPAGLNPGLAPDGHLWQGLRGDDGLMRAVRIDPHTGEIVDSYVRPNTPGSYHHTVSADGRFVAGGGSGLATSNTAWMLDLSTGEVYETFSHDQDHGAARGEFDADNNVWFGGRAGPLVQLVNEIDEGKGIHTRLFWPPTPLFPYTDFYTATPDKNGEVWGGVMHGRGFLRFNPKTDRWIVYENPEPSALNRFQWIDNSTTPPTIWYPDFLTQMFVRIQPLE